MTDATPTDRAITVLIVDDHAIVREGMRMLLEDVPTVTVVGEAADGRSGLELARELAPDVVLMDKTMPGMDGIEAIRHLRTQQPGVRALVLTGSFGEDLDVKEAIEAGAVGYLLKDILKDDLVHAIRRAAEGRATLHPEAQEDLLRRTAERPEPLPHHELTDRELDVLRLLGEGLSNKKIAARLGIAEGTVKGYVSIVLSKLNVRDRTQAALYTARHDLDA